MRILQVSNYMPPHLGGVETVAANLASAYRAAGHEVRWYGALPCGLRHDGHADDHAVGAWNITEQRLGFPWPVPSPRVRGALADAVRWCDVLHIHDVLYALNIAAMGLARRHRKAVVLTQHVGPVAYRSGVVRALQGAAYAQIGRRMMRAANQVVFVSDGVRDMFADVVFQREPVVIENGVDTSVFHPGDEPRVVNTGPTTLLYAGRLVAKKRLAILADMMRLHPEWQLRVAGSGDTTILEGVESVTLLGMLDATTLAHEMRNADVLVVPSRDEGFPVSAQEALCCGTPVIVSAQTAMRLATAPAGVFSPHADSANAFAQTVTTVLASDRRNEPSRDAAVRWSVAAVSHSYLDLMHRIAR